LVTAWRFCLWKIGGASILICGEWDRVASGGRGVRRYTISCFWLEFSVDVLAPAISYSSFTTRFSVGAFLIAAFSAWALMPQSGDLASVHGTVRDAQGRAVSQARVQLQGKDSKEVLSATTDAQGLYRISNLQHGMYVLRATGESGAAEIPSLALGPNESKTVDVVLGSAASSAQTTPQFYDEPQFTVSGVTDTTNLGGHGSDTVVRTRESLAKETAALTQPTAKGEGANASATEKSLRAELDQTPASFQANYRLGLLLLEHNKADEGMPFLRHAAEIQPGNAAVHHALGDAGEKLGDPLAAVREYQRAAEIDPSEPFLFDWGSELLLHHAPEPAIEVFTKGNSRYPKSARMLIGLGAAAFARGANEEAVQRMCEASDLNPVDAKPYLFLGKMLRAGNRPSQEELEKLQRFVKLQPENAEANYYYAVALWKSRMDPKDPAVSQAESLLARAVQLNRKFAAAYLELGILHAEERDYAKAIADYQQAIQIDPRLEEAHFRLGQAYRQAGEAEKSKEELRIHRQLAQESAQQIDRERHEIRQFVYTLRDKPTETH
jgi:tetratricopeptide (TPR) repeat protein